MMQSCFYEKIIAYGGVLCFEYRNFHAARCAPCRFACVGTAAAREGEPLSLKQDGFADLL